jgi:hypothetical protein
MVRAELRYKRKLVSLAQLAHKESKVFREFKVRMVFKDSQDSKALRVYKALTEYKEFKVRMVFKDSQDSKALRVFKV